MIQLLLEFLKQFKILFRKWKWLEEMVIYAGILSFLLNQGYNRILFHLK